MVTPLFPLAGFVAESQIKMDWLSVKRSPNRNKATGRRPSGDELPKQGPIPPEPAADQPVFGVRVPNYNTQRPRVQNKKMWWGWDFLQSRYFVTLLRCEPISRALIDPTAVIKLPRRIGDRQIWNACLRSSECHSEVASAQQEGFAKDQIVSKRSSAHKSRNIPLPRA